MKKAVKYKAISVKSIVALRQKENMCIKFGPLLILLDEIIRGSKIQRIKREKEVTLPKMEEEP